MGRRAAFGLAAVAVLWTAPFHPAAAWQDAARIQQALGRAATSFADGRFDEAERDCRTLLADPSSAGVELQILKVLSRVLTSQAKYGEAEKILLRAMDLAAGAAQPTSAFLEIGLAKVRSHQGRPHEALKLAERAVAALAELENGPEFSYACNVLGTIHMDLGLPDRALNTFDRAFQSAARREGVESRAATTVLNNQIEALAALGRTAEAAELCRRVLSARERTSGSQHLETATALHNCAIVEVKQNRLENAEQLLTRSLGIMERWLGPNHPQLFSTVAGLGAVRQAAGRYQEAAEFYSRALRLRIAVFGEEHPAVGTSLIDLASVEFEMGHYEQALTLFQRALAICGGESCPENMHMLQAWNGAGEAMASLGRDAEARIYHQAALRTALAVLGPLDPLTLKMQVHLAGDYEALGQLHEADSLLTRTLRVQERSPGAAPDSARTLGHLARVHQRMGEGALAERESRRMMEVLHRALPSGDPDIGIGLAVRGAILGAQGRLGEAAEAYRASLKILGETLGTAHRSYAEDLANLGRVEARLKHYREAEQSLSEAARIQQRTLDSGDPLLRSTWADLAWVLKKLRRNDEAEIIRARAAGAASWLR